MIPSPDRLLLSAGHRRSWAARQAVYREGDPDHTVLVISSGLVKVHTHGTEGDELILGLCGPGDVLGEGSAAGGAPRSAAGTALENVTAISIYADEIRAILAADPNLSLALLRLTRIRLHQADARRLESATAESLGRVISRLLELAERFGVTEADSRVDVPMPITQEELASWAGVSESTGRALRTLRGLGLIETGRRRVRLADVARLRQHAPPA